ncbi:murein L,D-transpeptidase catalytic domain family protein [Sphingomonas sp. TX0543]|uniref:murein L,D-transpeptidase catalytic domain family protein n=1 Tax=unclassified Sphingomonas TaxID=196159 RepID=UPI0010FA1369|nr:murein L,D-transpeptidase catalytic domain family protein [Sphingomonas sp. 3P27F8]
MNFIDRAMQSRRGLLKAGGLAAIGAVLPKGALAASTPFAAPRAVRPELMRRALAALERHGDRVQRDRIAIVDFNAPSAQPRFHFVDIASGATISKLVAHGSGSDPAHTGFVHRFSNEGGSNASSEGAFLATDYYNGKHGRSQRLIGLDPTNDNALVRAIVVHGAWYANAEMIRARGMLGRSQGCFAVGENELAEVFERLGPGRMIYAAKV